MIRKVFLLNQLSLLSIINLNKHVVYYAVYTAHAQNTHVVSIVITQYIISYRNSNETIAIFTLSILSPRPSWKLVHTFEVLINSKVLSTIITVVYFVRTILS